MTGLVQELVVLAIGGAIGACVAGLGCMIYRDMTDLDLPKFSLLHQEDEHHG